ncbi:MAG: DUF996 domain-containing protein [Methanomassiliicoccales archaeon]
MSVRSSRILGGVGSLLMFIGVFPYVNYFGIIEFVGLILIMIALHNLANYYNEGRIFSNALYALTMGLIGVVITIALVIVTVLTSLKDFLYTIFPDWNGDWTALSGLTPDMSRFSTEVIMPFLIGILAAFVVLWVFVVISAFFVRRSFGALSRKSGVGLFSTAGLLLLIGALLIILFGIGAILIWISALLLAIAFFSIKP